MAVSPWPPVKNSMHLCPPHPSGEAPLEWLWILSRFSHAVSWLERLRVPLRSTCWFASAVTALSSKAILVLEFLCEACSPPDSVWQIGRWCILFWTPLRLIWYFCRGFYYPVISNHSWDVATSQGLKGMPVNLPSSFFDQTVLKQWFLVSSHSLPYSVAYGACNCGILFALGLPSSLQRPFVTNANPCSKNTMLLHR